MKLNTNADYAHEADLLEGAVACLQSDLEIAIRENHSPARIESAKARLAQAKWRCLQFTKKYWHRIIAASHL